MVKRIDDDENKSCELVVAIWPKTGQKRDKIDVKHLESILGETHFVRKVEGNSLEAEILAQSVRQVINSHIVEPLSSMFKARAQEMITEWDRVKDRVEPLLQGRHSQCPACGMHALTPPVCDGDEFICPDCNTPLKWKKILNEKHPDQGYTVLVPR